MRNEMKQVGINLLTFESTQLAGVGNFFKRIFEALPPLPDVEFIFLCQRSFPLESKIRIPEGVNVRRLDVPDFRSKWIRVLYEQFVLPKLCWNFDVLYSPCVANPIIPIRPRKITTIYDLTPFFIKEKYGKVQGFYVRTMTKLLARLSDDVVTISESSRNDLLRVLDVREQKITVVYAFVEARDTSQIRYDPFFLTVGTQQPAKNLAGTISAFALFAQRHDTANHRLIVAGGSGWGEGRYAELVRELGMEDRIEFAGYVSDEELNRLYSTCKGHILLSFYEGFGIPILEALSWRKPSVASDVSSMPEVMGSTGFAVNPNASEDAARAIKAIADDPCKYLEGIREQLDKFSARKQVDAFLNVLRIRRD